MRKLALLGLTTALAGCNLAPKYVAPIAPVASTFPDATAGTRAATEIGWREFFGDPRLQTYIAAALANNRDLAQAVARVTQARAQYRITDADRLPQLEGVAGYTRSRQPTNALGFPATTTTGTGTLPGTGTGTGTTPGTGTGTTPGTGTPATPGTGIGTGTAATDTPTSFTFSQFSLGVQVASFELDFWGRVRNLSEAARREYLATAEAERAFRISLVAQVASTYLQIRAGQEQIVLAERTLTGRREGLRIAQRRLDAGVTSTVDFDQSNLLVTQAETELAELRRTTGQAENLLTVLVGGPVAGPLPAARPLSDPGQFANVEPGLPSALLANRPDILQAEQRLRAANANIGVARASVLPNISLTGLLGFLSPALGNLVDGDAFQYRVGANVTQPILTWGKAGAGLRLTRAQAEELAAAYQRTVQEAFREVADALVARRRYIEQIEAQGRAIEAQRRLVRVARLRYDNGLSIYLEVLDAERNLFTAEQTLLTLRSAQLQSEVSLYTALGGGLKEVSTAG